MSRYLYFARSEDVGEKAIQITAGLGLVAGQMRLDDGELFNQGSICLNIRTVSVACTAPE